MRHVHGAATNTKFDRVVVDSRDRDVALFPRPDRYDVRLHEDIFDVRSIKLMVADVPFVAYDVDNRNCMVPVRAGSAYPVDRRTASEQASAPKAYAVGRLPRGNYTPPELAAQLASTLSAATGDTVDVQYVPRTDNFTISCAGGVDLPFANMAKAPRPSTAGVAARLLGFSASKDHASPPGTSTLASESRRDSWTGSRYIVLHMEPAEVLKAFSSTIEKSFAVLQCREASDPCVCDNLPYEKTWDPPLARLSRFSFHFTDYDGRPWDFQNQEHRLELLVEHEGMRKYQF